MNHGYSLDLLAADRNKRFGLVAWNGPDFICGRATGGYPTSPGRLYRNLDRLENHLIAAA